MMVFVAVLEYTLERHWRSIILQTGLQSILETLIDSQTGLLGDNHRLCSHRLALFLFLLIRLLLVCFGPEKKHRG